MGGSNAKLDEMSVKAEKEAHAKEQTKKEVRSLEEEVFTLKRKVGHMSSELEEAREAQLVAQDEAARAAEMLRDLRLKGLISSEVGTGGGPMNGHYGESGHAVFSNGFHGGGVR